MSDETKRIEQHPIAKKARHFFVNLLDIRDDMMSYGEIDEMMWENTNIHGANMWILMLAILIASIGLNVNSTAVIIGAMLISPLMSGILTMGYSLAVKDLKMMRQALIRFGVQVIISLIASTMYFWISPLDEPTSEMIARTSPTIWDVLIALFGGIAGIIGNTRQKKGNVIPGVAIATALMPPLCTVGYGIATLQPRFILGAFYLFFINTLFIALSAALITVILRVPVHHNIDKRKEKRITRAVATIVVVTVVPSVLIGAYTVYNTYIQRNIDEYLKTEFVFSDTQLVQSNVNQNEKIIYVSLVGNPISDETISLLENQMENYNLGSYTLSVAQNKTITADAENTDKITIAVQENTISELQTLLKEQQSRLDELEQSAETQLDWNEISRKARQVFTNLSNCACGIASDGKDEYAILTAMTKTELSDSERAVIENWLKAESKMDNVRLFIIVEPPDTSDTTEQSYPEIKPQNSL